jgi:signal peptidase I
MSARSTASWAGTICGVAALAAAWLAFWPIGLGGSTGYAVIIGTSMEPMLHRGDVAVVRQSSQYHVGEAVAYHSRTLGRIVLHRIIRVHDGRYVFKGDANDFVDPGPAQRSDLIGRYWFKVGGAGPVIVWVQRPWHAALIAGILGIFLFGSGSGVAVRSRRRRRRRHGAPTPAQAPLRKPIAPVDRRRAAAWRPVAAVGVVALLVFAVLGVVANGLPATRQIPTDRLYEQTGHFSYAARVPASPAYPSGRVGSGEAVFTRLVHQLDLRYTWRFASARPHELHGTAALAADVSDGSGWTRRIQLVAPEPFAGDHVVLAGLLQLGSLEAMLHRFEVVTGTHAGSYQVSIVPTVKISGVLDGEHMSTAFAPPLQLSLDQARMQLATASDPATPNSLVRSKQTGGSLTQPSRIRLVAGRQLALRTAKHTALLGGAAALALLLVALLLRIAQRGPADEAARIRARYGRAIVRVAAVSPTARVVEVADFDDLARIAERYDRVVLHEDAAGVFVVEEEGVSYRWRPAGPAAAGPLARIADVVEQHTTERGSERRDLERRPWSSPRRDDPAGVDGASALPDR